MPTTDLPEPVAIAAELRRVVRSGLSLSRLKDLPVLFGLALVATEARGNRVLDRAVALEQVLGEAVAALGEGPTGECMRLLLGMTARSRGLLLKERRDLAAEHLGIAAETFRKQHEPELVAELADELYKLESERRVPVRVLGRRRRGPVLDDLREGTGGKSLARRAAEARLWSLAYAFRADALQAQLGREQAGESGATPVLDQALLAYAVFLDAMAAFVDDFGSALVMAGNEVTVQEAAALLRVKPPLSDEQATRLRLVLANIPTRDVDMFMAELGQTAVGREIISLWRGWLG